MFNFLKRFFPPKYKIFHHPDYGYIPAEYDQTLGGYWVIQENLTIGNNIEEATCQLYAEQWCKTEEEAGQRLNKYDTGGGTTVVWSSR